MKKRTKATALGLATAILTHPEVQKQVKKLAEAGFKKAREWWVQRASRKKLNVLKKSSSKTRSKRKRAQAESRPKRKAA